MVVWLLAMVGFAADHPCDPAFADACVDPSVVVMPGAEVQRGASIGPDVVLGSVVIGARAVLDGRDQGALAQPVGDGTVVGRRAMIGADASIGEDVQLGRVVTIGTGFDAGDMSAVGYGSELGDNVTLQTNAVLGSLVTVGSDAIIGGVVARGATVHDGAQVSGVVGPHSAIGADAVVDGRVHKEAVIGEAAVVHAGARVGRGATLEYGVELQAGASVDSGAFVPVCGRLGSTDRLRRGETWAGGTVPGCVEPGSADPYPIRTNATGEVQVHDMVTDSATGDVYIAGEFKDEISFGQTTLTSVDPTGSSDGFIASYAGDGALRWVRHVVANNYSGVTRLALHGDGLYVSGSFADQMTLDGETFTNAAGLQDLFVARLHASTGSRVWGRQLQTNAVVNGHRINDIAVTADGVYVVGNFGESMDLLGPGAVSLSTSGLGVNSDGFFLRLNHSGTWLLARRVGGNSSDQLLAITPLPNGNLALGGYLFSAPLTSGNNAFASGLSAADGIDGMLFIVTPTGGLVTQRLVSGPGITQILDLVATTTRLYTVLRYSSSLSFGSTQLSGHGGSEQAVGWLSLSGVPGQAYNPAPSRAIKITKLVPRGSGVAYSAYTLSGDALSLGSTSVQGPAAMAVALSSSGVVQWAAVSDVSTSPISRALAPHSYGGVNGFVFAGHSRGIIELGPNRFGADNDNRHEGFVVPLSDTGEWGSW